MRVSPHSKGLMRRHRQLSFTDCMAFRREIRKALLAR